MRFGIGWPAAAAFSNAARCTMRSMFGVGRAERAAGMRAHHDVVQLVEGKTRGHRMGAIFGCLGVSVPHVQTGRGRLAPRQAMVKRGFVHHRTPADVDQDGAVRQQRQLLGADQPARFAVKGRVMMSASACGSSSRKRSGP